MATNYELIERKPTIEEYRALCISVGWENFMNFDVAEEAIANSLYAVVIEHNGETVGMGRIVGDGKIYFYIQDIVVSPEHQNQGLGKKILENFCEYLKANAPQKSFVGLFAAAGKAPFYERFEFADYSPNMTGMFRVIT